MDLAEGGQNRGVKAVRPNGDEACGVLTHILLFLALNTLVGAQSGEN